MGTGAILLLGRFTPDEILRLRAEMSVSFVREAIKYSRDFPSSPNLWIRAMETCDQEGLQYLSNTQGILLSADQTISILKRNLSNIITLSIILPPIVRSLANFVNWAPLKAIHTYIATGVTALTITAWTFWSDYSTAVKERRLSKAHREQLEVALGDGEK